MSYTVKDILFNLRLEPIVYLRDGCTVGFEALSRLADRSHHSSFNYEIFFSDLSADESIHIIERQLEIYQKWSAQHPEIYGGKSLFINVSPLVLEDQDACNCFIPFLRYFNIAIEVDNHLSMMSEQAKRNIAVLKSYGMQIWVDDFDGSGNINDSFWNGVKIDRWAFQDNFKLASSGNCGSNYSEVMHVGPLVIEGIENEDHLEYAVSIGARYGQGYLWAAH